MTVRPRGFMTLSAAIDDLAGFEVLLQIEQNSTRAALQDQISPALHNSRLTREEIDQIRLSWLAKQRSKTIHNYLKTALCREKLFGYVASADGHFYSVPAAVWASQTGDAAFFTDQLSFSVGGVSYAGICWLAETEVQALFLEKPVTRLFPLPPSESAAPRTDRVPNEPDSAQVGRAERSRPQRSRAGRVLRELYPGGIPPRDEVPDAVLVQKVLAQVNVSRESVLRAAGRKK